jgi:hypothetical protein
MSILLRSNSDPHWRERFGEFASYLGILPKAALPE